MLRRSCAEMLVFGSFVKESAGFLMPPMAEASWAILGDSAMVGRSAMGWVTLTLAVASWCCTDRRLSMSLALSPNFFVRFTAQSIALASFSFIFLGYADAAFVRYTGEFLTAFLQKARCGIMILLPSRT